MARHEGIYRRPDSILWWINATLPNGKRVRQSAGTDVKEDAEAYLAKLKLDAYRETHFGIKPQRSWQEAVVRYLELKRTLRMFYGCAADLPLSGSLPGVDDAEPDQW